MNHLVLAALAVTTVHNRPCSELFATHHLLEYPAVYETLHLDQQKRGSQFETVIITKDKGQTYHIEILAGKPKPTFMLAGMVDPDVMITADVNKLTLDTNIEGIFTKKHI